MIILQAPHELIQLTTVLPNPVFGDGENIASEMTLRRSMSGLAYTTIKTNDRHKLTYDFILTRKKALELQIFVKTYYDQNIRLTNHKDEVWLVKLLTDPFQFEINKRFERNSISLEFEGERLNG